VKLRLYIDEDAMNADLVRALRLRGVDVASAWESGTRGYSDEHQLEFAAMQGRALYSFNVKDYMPMHARFMEQQKSHAGIILTSQRQYSIGEQLRRLLSLVADMSAEDMRDQVVFLSAWGKEPT
jgi:Domain of unknown function (DUF5615)